MRHLPLEFRETRMLFREHKGSLDEAMKTVCYVRDRQHLIEIVRDRLTPWQREVPDDGVHVEAYAYDQRIGWDSHIVTLDGYGVLGFVSARLDERTSELPAVRFRERLDSTGAQMESVKGVENLAGLIEILETSFRPYGRSVRLHEVMIGDPSPEPRPQTWTQQLPVLVQGYGTAGWLSGPLEA